MASRDQCVPNRRLPVLYLAFAHGSMLLAVAVVTFDPISLTGYFYQPLMIGVVHLVTLGWISGSILGALFIVGPPSRLLGIRVLHHRRVGDRVSLLD